MSEETEVVVPETQTNTDESTAAAAAFSGAFSDGPVAVEPEVVETKPEVRTFAGKTEEELAAILSEIPNIKDGYRKQIDNLAGNYGALKASLQSMQQQAPVGVEVTDEDMKELMDEYPELAVATKNSLTNVLKKLNMRGQAAPVIDDARIAELVNGQVARERVQMHIELLDGMQKGWRDIVGEPGADNDYRKWMTTQPVEYQQKMLNSNNAFEIIDSIKAFQSDQTAAIKKREQNRQRLADAVQPKGQTAAHVELSENQAAAAAFKAARGR